MWVDNIPGGLADNMEPEDFDSKALRKGIRVELEHTGDRTIAKEIAMDHLFEDPEYYDKLETIEKHKNPTSNLMKNIVIGVGLLLLFRASRMVD